MRSHTTTPRSVLRRALTGAALALALVAPSAVGATAAAAAPPVATVLRDGLSSPKGVTLDKTYQPIVPQGAFGPPGPVVRVRTQPPNVGAVEALSPVLGATGVAYVRKTNTTWILGSDGVLYRQKRFGEAPLPVRDIAAFAAANPDPTDTEGLPGESNPFGLAALSNGNALVTDAAANSLLRVTPSGKASLVARFPLQSISTAHVGDPNLPPAIPAEAVPTGVTVGPDGHIYVAELKGFPFTPGTSRIWRIEPNATGAVCSVDPKVRRGCRLAYDGFTGIASIAFDQTGALYVFQYSAAGILAFEGGCQSSAGCPPALLQRVVGSTRTELAAGELSEPGWMVAHGSTLYLTDHVLSGGRLLSIPI